MMTTIKPMLRWYVICNVFVLIVSLTQGTTWVINTQAAFACSLLITMASYRSYASLVKARVASGDIPEDPYEKHYAEEEENAANETEVLKQTPKIGLKQGFHNLALSYKSSFSLYRIGSYVVLVITMLFLIRHGWLNTVAFFVGLSIIPVCSLISVWSVKKGLNETNE